MKTICAPFRRERDGNFGFKFKLRGKILDIGQTLRILTEKVGVSGDERLAAEKAAELLREYAEDVKIDEFGNVTGRVRARNQSVGTIMLDAHIDQVGLIVTYIDENGFVNVGSCGGIDEKILLAQSVTIHGKESVLGVISTLPPHVSKDKKVPEISDISIDVGLTKEEAEKVISLGDRVTVNSKFRFLSGDIANAPAVDDRAGVCAILAALEMTGGKSAYDIDVCFSTQEETGERGVKQAAFGINPDRVIAVDVSFGNTPDSDPKQTAKLGSGVMIGFSASLDKRMSNKLRKIAVAENIPFTCEVMPSSTGTNADAAGVVGRGAKCSTLSIPIRYMHTPVECVKISDIEACAKLISEYLTGGSDDA